MKKDISNLLNQFKNYTVVILGDVMLDYNISGNVNRISPEAPIPVVDVNNLKHLPGGAANVASNIRSLGGNVHLLGVVGCDDNARTLKDALQKNDIRTDFIVEDAQRPTTTKMRIFSGRHPYVRADIESKQPINSNIEETLLSHLKNILPKADALIFQDYNKGVLTASLITKTIALCKQHNVLTAVDPKLLHFFDYVGVDIFKPNRKELFDAMKQQPKDRAGIQQLAVELHARIGAKNVLVTLSEDGMLVVGPNLNVHIPTKAREVFDPTGAGDTVIASLVLSYLATQDIVYSMKIANIAASITCSKTGVAHPTAEELLENIPDSL